MYRRGQIPGFQEGFGTDTPGLTGAEAVHCAQVQACAESAGLDGSNPDGFFVYYTPADSTYHCRRIAKGGDFTIKTTDCKIDAVYGYALLGLRPSP